MDNDESNYSSILMDIVQSVENRIHNFQDDKIYSIEERRICDSRYQQQYE